MVSNTQLIQRDYCIGKMLVCQREKVYNINMKNIENFEIPENVGYILHILEENGYEGYAVGGCVRDMLLGRTPGDWDITTSAKYTFR